MHFESYAKKERETSLMAPKARKAVLTARERTLILRLFQFGVSMSLLGAASGRGLGEIQDIIREALKRP